MTEATIELSMAPPVIDGARVQPVLVDVTLPPDIGAMLARLGEPDATCVLAWLRDAIDVVAWSAASETVAVLTPVPKRRIGFGAPR